MNPKHRRRRFLQTAAALGLGADFGPWVNLRMITPLRGRDPGQARDGQVPPGDRARRALSRGDAP